MEMNSFRKYLLLICFAPLCLLNSACNNESVIHVDHIIFNLPNGWFYKQVTSNKYEIYKDTIRVSISLVSDSIFTDSHLRSPIEYIQTEDPNFLTGFAFNIPGIIYTTKENIEKVKRQNNDSEMNIEENPKPILERILKVDDSLLNKDGVDYLCRFHINDKKEWLPVKLPDYYKNFQFIIDTANKTYRKFYLPINGSDGKFGLLTKDSSHHRVLSAHSSLINDRANHYKEVLIIFRSIKMVD